MQGKRIFLGVSGSIAAYKAAELARLFIKAGAQVQVGLSEGAKRFIQPLTFEAITGQPVLTSLWGSERSQIEHVEQAHEVDLCVVAPATANLLARMAAGMADDIVCATCLSTGAPILVAPAMETGMWENPATQANLATLRARGVRVVDPAEGDLASGRRGIGRLAELDEIAQAAAACLQPRDLKGLHLVITAGPTYERIDPVRILSNRSTGAMGIAFANVAQQRGAKVDLILGPTHLVPPAKVNTHRVESAREMLAATEALIDQADVFVATAAVSDFRPAEALNQKLKRSDTRSHEMMLTENPDILATLAPRVKTGLVIGFAAETQDLEKNARDKLARKGCHMVVANQVGPTEGFGLRSTQVKVVQSNGTTMDYGPATKKDVAGFVLDLAKQGLDNRGESA